MLTANCSDTGTTLHSHHDISVPVTVLCLRQIRTVFGNLASNWSGWDKWQALVNMVMNLQIPYGTGVYLLKQLLASQGLWSMEVVHNSQTKVNTWQYRVICNAIHKLCDVQLCIWISHGGIHKSQFPLSQLQGNKVYRYKMKLTATCICSFAHSEC